LSDNGTYVILGLEPHKFAKRPNTNYKLGMSKDSPFVNEYTEYHRLTKNLFHPSLEPKIKSYAKNDKK